MALTEPPSLSFSVPCQPGRQGSGLSLFCAVQGRELHHPATTNMYEYVIKHDLMLMINHSFVFFIFWGISGGRRAEALAPPAADNPPLLQLVMILVPLGVFFPSNNATKLGLHNIRNSVVCYFTSNRGVGIFDSLPTLGKRAPKEED